MENIYPRDKKFAIFTTTCKKTLRELGIAGSWDVSFVDDPKEEDQANCSADWKAQQVTFTMGQPDEKTDIAKLARHEVGHVLSCGFRDLMDRRYVSRDEFEFVDEWFANIMEKILP